MSWFVPKKKTDEEIILRARTNLHDLEQWGRWLVAFRIAAVIAISLLTGWVVTALFGFVVGAAGNRIELCLGFVLGFFGGFSCYKIGFHFAMWHVSMLPDERDRLLVQYHDALSELLARSRNP